VEVGKIAGSREGVALGRTVGDGLFVEVAEGNNVGVALEAEDTTAAGVSIPGTKADNTCTGQDGKKL
jgi:hypothetical protein